MNFKLLLLLFLLSSKIVLSQSNSAIPENIRSTNTLDRLSESSGINAAGAVLLGIPVPKGELIGDFYLNVDWQKTSFTLIGSDKVYEGYECRYNIESNQLEIKSQTGVNGLSGTKIKSFVWIDSKTSSPTFFINAQDYSFNEKLQSGFLNVLSDGKIPLFKQTTTFIRTSNYRPELHAGSRDSKIFKIEKFYFSKGKSLFQVKPKDLKKPELIFGDSGIEIKKFIESQSLSLNNESDLIKVFNFYNSLNKMP